MYFCLIQLDKDIINNKTDLKMKTRIFTSSDFKDLKIDAIARKHKCSGDYVRRVLKGERERNTDLAQKIVADANDMLQIVERETVINTQE